MRNVQESSGNYSAFLDKCAARGGQIAATGGEEEIPITVGSVKRDNEGLYRDEYRGRISCLGPQVRRSSCNNGYWCGGMKDAGHRGVETTTERLRAYQLSFSGGGREYIRNGRPTLRRQYSKVVGVSIN